MGESVCRAVHVPACSACPTDRTALTALTVLFCSVCSVRQMSSSSSTSRPAMTRSIACSPRRTASWCARTYVYPTHVQLYTLIAYGGIAVQQHMQCRHGVRAHGIDVCRVYSTPHHTTDTDSAARLSFCLSVSQPASQSRRLTYAALRGVMGAPVQASAREVRPYDGWCQPSYALGPSPRHTASSAVCTAL
jgi:hypothetical protein